MLVMRTIENPAYPIRKLISSQKTVGFDDLALAVYPLGLYGVQPRTLFGQKTTHNPHPASALLDFAVVSSEPPSDLSGDVPGSVVPDEDHDLLAKSFELLAELHSRNRVVMELMGLPSTKRSHVSPIWGR
jgi:hypothetical protein